jgi:hypothetical protein
MLIRKDFSKHGWTLVEFGSRLCGGEYWQRWQSAIQKKTDALATLPTAPEKPESIGDFEWDSNNKRRYARALRRWKSAHDALIGPLELQEYDGLRVLKQKIRDELSTGRYVVTASRDEADDSDRIEIVPDVWSTLGFDLQSCSGRYGRIREKKHLYRIRVFPPLTGLNSAEVLADMPIVEAYCEFVLGDADLYQAVKSVDNDVSVHAKIASLSSAFPFGQDNNEIWPVMQVRESYDRERTSVPDETGPIGFLSDTSDWSHSYVNQIFHERLGALFSHLASGTLVARGISIDGSMLDLPRSIWLSGFDKAVDFNTGDLVQLGDNDSVQVLFRSLMLHEPAATDAPSKQPLATEVSNRELQMEPRSKGKKIYAAQAVEHALLRFAELNKLDGEALQKHMQKHGEKSRWINGFLQDGTHEFSESAVRKQLNINLGDPNWLEKLRSN